MRKGLGEYNTPAPASVPSTNPDTGFVGSFGHPLDMLARTAANTHSPTEGRFVGPAGNSNFGVGLARQPLRLGPAETMPTTWSADLSGIDPVERGWLELDHAKALFERYSQSIGALGNIDSGEKCSLLCLLLTLDLIPLISNKFVARNQSFFSV